MRSQEEIAAKIKELVNDQDNFIDDNYGSEAADNGFYETYFSKSATETTLQTFANWLLEAE